MSSTDSLSLTLSALADPTRRQILAQLSRGDATVNALAAPFAMSTAAVSKHLKVLENAGLISRGKQAQFRPCHLEAAPLRDVTTWLEDYRRFWDRSLDRFAAHLKSLAQDAPSSKPAASRPGSASPSSRSKTKSSSPTKRKKKP